MTLEQEVKLAAPVGVALPDLRQLVGGTLRLPEQHMVTRYFDTADGRLWQQGMTLRHRKTGAADEGTWTLKVPRASNGPALRRSELEWPGVRNEIPGAALTLLRGVIRRQPVVELATLETTRQRLVLRDHADHEVAELDDDIVQVVGGTRDGTRFRQVELEYRDQDWNGRRVLRQLEKAGARVERSAKLAKALSLPDPSSPGPTVGRHSTTADVVRVSLCAGLDRVISHDWRLRLADAEPCAHDVHQARVATRRLRSDLKTFSSVLDPLWVLHVRNDLQWLGRALGEVRDLDVLAESLSDAPLQVRQRLDVQRLGAARELTAVLASTRYVNLLDRLDAAAPSLPVAPGRADVAERRAARVLPSLVARRWRAVRHQVRSAGHHPSAAQLHRIRIKAKQLRYAAEAATPVIGREARRTATAAERVQTVLGEHHDAVAAEAWLRDAWTGDATATVAPATSPQVSFEVGRLVADLHRRQHKKERHWADAWAELRDPRRRRWMHRH